MAYQDPALTGSVPQSLVNLRQFVGSINAALNDQSYADTDNVVHNPTGQFVTMTPTGQASIEGQPVMVRGPDGSLTFSPVAVMLLALAGLYFATR